MTDHLLAAITHVGAANVEAVRLVTAEVAKLGEQALEGGQALADELVAQRLLETQRHQAVISLLAQILQRLPGDPVR